MGLTLVGFGPNLFNGDSGDTPTLLGAALFAGCHVVAILVCVLKGKYELALLGAFVPFLVFVCAVRMARQGR